jgi:hypothetical protein
VLGKLTRQDQTDSARELAAEEAMRDWGENVRGLDLARRDGGLLVVGSELGGLGGDALEDVVDERVEDAHGAVGDTGVGVDLLEDWKTRQHDAQGKAESANSPL